MMDNLHVGGTQSTDLSKVSTVVLLRLLCQPKSKMMDISFEGTVG